MAHSNSTFMIKPLAFLQFLMPHCSYLNIYISRKISPCVVDLEGQFQTTLQAKDIKFMIWKFNSITYLFSFSFYFLQEFQIQAFCTLLMLFQRVGMFELRFDAKITIILIFLLFFAEFVKSSAFYTLLLLFQRIDISKLWFDAKMWFKWFILLGIASTVCKKQCIW